MTNLTQANLEAMLIELCKQVGEKGETVTIKPTKIIYRPSYLAKLGLTIDDVIKLVEKEINLLAKAYSTMKGELNAPAFARSILRKAQKK